MRSLLTLAVLAALRVWGAEYAVLSSGFRIRVDRHEKAGDEVRLISGSGEIVLPAGQVVRFEPEEPAAAVPPSEPAPEPITSPRKDIKALIDEAAQRYGLPPALVHSVVKAESGYRADAVSPKGAIGVMQLMPATASAMAVDPRDPVQNIEAGSRILSELLDRYDRSANLALAAYNAGTGAVAKHNGVPPYRETQLYVDRVIRDYLRQNSEKSTIRPISE
jgi:soluble lytic murein transglycosylase-like protein